MTMRSCSRGVCSYARASAVVAVTVLALGCHARETRPARVFVSNENAGTVSVIDPQAGKTIATIPIGKRPRGIHVSHDGKYLYVALSGSPKGGPGVDEASLPPADRAADGIGVVDLRTLELVDTIQSGQDPESFDLVDDRLLIVSNEETKSATVIDLASRKVRATISVGAEPEGVATAPDGSVWVTSEADNAVSVIDPDQDRVIATIPTGLRPRGIAFNHKYGVVTDENDGSLTVVDIAARSSVARVQLPMTGALQPRPMGVVIDKQGHYAYVTTGRAGSVVVLDLETRRIAKTFEHVGQRPWGITIGRDGMLYSANGPSDDVAVIDPASGRIVRRIVSGGSPWGIASN